MYRIKTFFLSLAVTLFVGISVPVVLTGCADSLVGLDESTIDIGPTNNSGEDKKKKNGDGDGDPDSSTGGDETITTTGSA